LIIFGVSDVFFADVSRGLTVAKLTVSPLGLYGSSNRQFLNATGPIIAQGSRFRSKVIPGHYPDCIRMESFVFFCQFMCLFPSLNLPLEILLVDLLFFVHFTVDVLQQGFGQLDALLQVRQL
jgi:hypothetical protein